VSLPRSEETAAPSRPGESETSQAGGAGEEDGPPPVHAGSPHGTGEIRAGGRAKAGRAARRRGAGTLAFVESPVQLLNVLEWAHQHQASSGVPAAAGEGRARPLTEPDREGSVRGPRGGPEPERALGPELPQPQPRRSPEPESESAPESEPEAEAESERTESERTEAEAERTEAESGAETAGRDLPDLALPELTIVVLSPHDPMTRGQLRRVAELARDEGITVRWQEARDGVTAPLKTVGSLAGELRRAHRVVIGDPFSRYVQLMLTLTKARNVVVVDDGTATMEFVSQLARGERFVRWHRNGTGGPQAMLFAPFSRRARVRLTPGTGSRTGAVPRTGAGAEPGEGGREPRRVEVFSSMPVGASHAELAALGVTVTSNGFAWTRSRFGPPRLTKGTDLVGTSLVETGVVDLDCYLRAVASLARKHGATRYFAHRRENSDKLQRVTAATGLEIVRPDLPLELVARRGPIGRTILSFPSTVVHTLPLALAGTPVTVAVCEVQRSWLTESASPRAEGFLSGVTGSARGVRRLGPPAPGEPAEPEAAEGEGREPEGREPEAPEPEGREGPEKQKERERAEKPEGPGERVATGSGEPRAGSARNPP
jgi:hypothetical protein